MTAANHVKTFAEIEAEKRAGSPYPKCTLWMRLCARAVDLVIAWGIFWAAGVRFGPVLAILYVLFADGIFEGQSIGKRIFGIKVVHLPTRSPGRKRDSTLRNAPLALPILLGMMPEVGWVAFVAGAVVIGGVETVRVLRDPLGLRFGDVWAETQVVDGKVVAASGVGVVSRDQTTATGRVTSRVMFAARHRRDRYGRSQTRRRRSTRCG
ncbi:MAG: RDD family protein [Myxococcaceae bacterium]|nr:RDD family protein [Myxococcaceae bacterium]